MSKYILVGDMHVKPDSIEECAALMRWVVQEAKRLDAIIVLMGDQTDTHGTVRVEVLDFWSWVFHTLFRESGIKSVTLVGNHDMNFACTDDSMRPFMHVTKWVGREPQLIEPGIFAIGYVKDNKEFVQKVSTLTDSIVLCHQEFNGAMYESGFYAPGGAKLADVPACIRFISGHIHLKQSIGDRVFYVGTPRQINRSDSDPDKSIWLLSDGNLTQIRVPDTVVPRFQRIQVRETDGAEVPSITNLAKTFVDIHGSAEFIKKVLNRLPDGVKARTFPAKQTTAMRGTVRESDGLGKALGRYASSYFQDNKVSHSEANRVMLKLKEFCPSIMV